MAEQALRPPFTPPIYDNEDLQVAISGQLESIDWQRCKDPWSARLRSLISTYTTHSPDVLATRLEEFEAPPHTVQRLAELLHDPASLYTDADKYHRALSRVLSVSSTIDDFPADHTVNDAVEDALLVPIPWLVNADGSLNGSNNNNNDTSSSGTVTTEMRTVMPNGVAITTGGTLADFQDIVADDADAVLATRATGSAPIDAADVGMQPQSVLDTIAAAGAPSTVPPAVQATVSQSVSEEAGVELDQDNRQTTTDT